MIDYEAETQEFSDEDLEGIALLAKRLVQWKQTVHELEDKLKIAKKSVQRIEEELLPTAMNNLGGVGMTEFTLGTGQMLKLNKALHMSIPKKNKSQVCQWAMTHGLKSLVRTELSVDFGAGEAERAETVKQQLEKMGYDHVLAVTDINTASLKAAVKEMMEQGKEVPLKLMGGYEREYVEIK